MLDDLLFGKSNTMDDKNAQKGGASQGAQKSFFMPTGGMSLGLGMGMGMNMGMMSMAAPQFATQTSIQEAESDFTNNAPLQMLRSVLMDQKYIIIQKLILRS